MTAEGHPRRPRLATARPPAAPDRNQDLPLTRGIAPRYSRSTRTAEEASPSTPLHRGRQSPCADASDPAPRRAQGWAGALPSRRRDPIEPGGPTSTRLPPEDAQGRPADLRDAPPGRGGRDAEGSGRQVTDPPQATPGEQARRAGILGFVLCLTLPVILQVGSLNLPPARLFLLAVMPMAALALLTGRLGRILAADLLIALTALWWAGTLFLHHPPGTIYQYAGFTVLETWGGYLAGRFLVRTTGDFRFAAACLFGFLVLTLPAALLETQTGQPILIDALRGVIATQPIIDYPTRLGLHRAQVVFPHPILYGIFAAGAFALAVAVLNRRAPWPAALARGATVTAAAVSSVSSGALLALSVQAALFGWNRLLSTVRARWWLLLGLGAGAYLILDLLSDRTPAHLLASYISLNPQTAYVRIQTFEIGWDLIRAHPLSGVGLGPWAPPGWPVPSVDNFWLLIAMRHGVPGFLLFAGGVAALTLAVARRPLGRSVERATREGWLIALAGFGAALTTVHAWAGLFVWILFLLGAGAFLAAPSAAERPRPQLPYTRALGDRA